MAGHLDAAAMRLVDRGGKLAARDLHVGLERRRPSSVQYCTWRRASSGPFNVRNLDESCRTVQVRRRRTIAGPGFWPASMRRSCEVHEPIHVAALSHRRHAAGEIQAREAFTELSVNAGAIRVIEVFVHNHEAGMTLLPVRSIVCAPQDIRAGRAAIVVMTPLSGSTSGLRACRAGAVDHAHVRQSDQRRINGDVARTRLKASAVAAPPTSSTAARQS